MSVTNGDLKVLIDNLATLFNKHFVGGNYNFTGRAGAFVFTHDNFYFATLPSPTVQTLGLTGAVTELNFVLDWIDHRNEVVGQTITVRLLDKDDNFLAAKIATNNGYGYNVTFNLPADLLAGVTNQDVRKLQVVSLNPTGNTIAVGQVNGATNISITGTEFVDQVIPDLIIQDLEAIKTQTDRLPTRELNGLTVGNVAKESTSSGSAIFTAPTDQFTADGTGVGYGWFDNPVEQLLGIEEDILAVDFRLMYTGSADGATILVELLDINKNVMSEKQVQTTTSGYQPAVFNLPEDLATGVTSLSVKYLRVTGINADNRVYFGTPFTVSITGQRSVDTADNAGILLKLDEIQEELIDAEHKFDIDMNEFIFEPFSNETFGFYRSASSNSENVFTQQLGLSGNVDELTFSLKWTDVITTIAKDIRIDLQDKNNKTLATKTANTGTTGVDVVFNLPVDLNTDETSRLVTQVKVTATAFTQLRSGKTGRIISITGVQKDAVLSNLVDIKSIVLSDTPKIDDIKTQTDRLPTVTANDGTISGDVAKLSIQTTGGGEGGFSSVDRINLNNVKTDVETLLHEYNIVLPITSFPFTVGGGLLDRLPFATQDLGIDENITAITITLNWSNLVGGIEAFAVDLLDIDGIQVETFVMNPNQKFYGNNINGTTFTFDSQFIKQIRFRQTGLQGHIVVGATNPYLNITGLATHAHENIINKIDAIKTETDGIKSQTDKVPDIKSQTDKLSFIQNDITGIKSNVSVVKGDVVSVKTETDKIPTVLTNLDINKTSIAANKTEIDLIKTQTDKVPSIIGEVNNVKLQTDKIPATIVKVDSIKTQTDKIPTVLTNQGGINDSINTNKTAIDAIKLDTSRLPTIDTDGVITGNVAKQDEVIRTLDIPTTAFVLTKTGVTGNYTYGTQSFETDAYLTGITVVFTWSPAVSGGSTFNMDLLDKNDVVLETKEMDVQQFYYGDSPDGTTITFEPQPVTKVRFTRLSGNATIFVGTTTNTLTLKATLASVKQMLSINVENVKIETDKIPTILTDVASNKEGIELVGEVVSSNKNELVKVKTETDKIPTVLTNITANKTEIDLIKTQTDKVPATITKIDAIKVQSDRLPTVTVDGVTSGDVAKESTQDGGNIPADFEAKVNAIKTQTDKTPATIVKVDAIKVQTDKVPATITKIDAIKVQSDRLPTKTLSGVTSGDVAKETDTDIIDTVVDAVKVQTDKIPTVLTNQSGINDSINTNKTAIDAVKVDTGRMPTVDIAGVISTDIAKESTQALNSFTSTDRGNLAEVKVQADKIPTVLTNQGTINTSVGANNTAIAANKTEIDLIKTQTDKVPATIVKVDAIKVQTDRLPTVTVDGVTSGDVAKESTQDGGNIPADFEAKVNAIKTQTDKTPATIVKVDLIKTQTDKIPTVLTDIGVNKTAIGTNKAELDLIKIQTDRLPTKTLSGVTSGDVAKQTDLSNVIGTTNNIKTQTDKVPATITKIDAIKTETDKIPTVLTNQGTINTSIGTNKTEIDLIKTQTDKVPATITKIDSIKTQTDKIPTVLTNQGTLSTSIGVNNTAIAANKTEIDLIKTQTDKMPVVVTDLNLTRQGIVANSESILAVKVQTDRLPTKTVDSVVSGNVAKQDAITASFAANSLQNISIKAETDKLPATIIKVDAIKLQTDRLPTLTDAGGVVTGDVAKESTQDGGNIPADFEQKVDDIKTQTDRLPTLTTNGVTTGDVAKESTLEATNEFTFDAPTYSFVFVPEVGEDYGSYGTSVVQDLGLDNDVKELVLELSWTTSLPDQSTDTTVELLDDNNTALATKSFTTGAKGGKVTFKLPDDLNSGVTSQDVRFLKIKATAGGTTEILSGTAGRILTINGIGLSVLTEDIIKIKTQTDRLPLSVTDSIISSDIALNSKDLSTTQKNKITGLSLNTAVNVAAIKGDTSVINADTTTIKIQNAAINADVDVVKANTVTLKSELLAVDTGVNTIKTQTDKIPSVKTQTDKIPATIEKIDAIKIQSDRLPTKTVGSVVSGDVAKESTQTTDAFTAADRTAIGAIKTDTVALKTDSAAIKTDTTTLKSGQDEIKNDLITLFNNTDDVQVEVDKIKVDTTELLTTALTNAEKAKIQGLPSDLGNSLTAIKTDTTTLKGTTVNIKSDTTSLLNDTSVIKGDADSIESKIDTLEAGVDNIEIDVNIIKNNDLTTAQKAKIDAIPLSIAADINDIEIKIDAIKVEVDNITSVETKIDALKIQLTNKETGLSSTDKAELIAAIILTEQYDYQQTTTEFIVTDSTNSDAVIARFTLSKDSEGNVTRRQLQ